MTTLLLAGAALLALMTGAASAASPGVDVQATGTVVKREQIEAHTLMGKTVVDSEGVNLGTVDDVIIDASGKMAQTAVIKLSGAIGEKLIAVPIADLKPGADDETLRLEGLSREQVNDMKPYRPAAASTASNDQPAAVSGNTTPATGNPADLDPRLLIGHEVIDVHGRKIGTVDNLLMNDSGNQPLKAIIKSGGFLGMGAKLIAVDFATLHSGPNPTNNVLSPGVLIATGLTQEQVRRMEDFRYDPAMRTYRRTGS
jgi:sporulation protein YlmC with PRC-barrel domain